MPRKQLSNLDFNSVARIINLVDPTGAQDGATKAYVDANIEGLAWKDSARVGSVSNITVSAPGATIDGITMVSGDRLLLRAQTTGHENGLYIWNGAATAATRANDASTFPELEAAVVTVEEGTHAGVTFRQSAVNGTLGSTSVVWATFGTSSPSATETVQGIAEIATQGETDTGTDDARFVTPLKLAASVVASRKYNVAFGDGSATSYTITHSLNSRNVHVTVYLDSGNFEEINCDVLHATVNTITLLFAAAPTSNQYRVFVTA